MIRVQVNVQKKGTNWVGDEAFYRGVSDAHLDHVGIESRTQHGRHQADVVRVQVGLEGGGGRGGRGERGRVICVGLNVK